MKRILFFITFFIFLSFVSIVRGAPTIESISINPTNPYLGEEVNATVKCYETNETIKSVTGYITRLSPDKFEFAQPISFVGNETYTGTITTDYLQLAGDYNLTIECEGSDTATSSKSFHVSELASYLASPSTGYVGENVSVKLLLKLDGQVLTSSNISFDVNLNNEQANFVVKGKDSNNNWIIEIPLPSEGNKELKITAFYDRTKTVATSTIEVKQPIQLEVSLNKDAVVPNEELIVNLKVQEKGNPVQLKKENIEVQIDSNPITIQEISTLDNITYALKLTTPTLSPKSYPLQITFKNYKSYSPVSKIIDLTYVVPVSGKIGSAATLKFISGSIEKIITTDSNGQYSDRIPAGNYSIQIEFPQSTLQLSNVAINTFDDPIKYFYLPNVTIDGVRSAGTFVFEVALQFSSALIEMKYDAAKILDEEKLSVYRCSNWNSGREICNSGWEEISAEIDTVKDLAKINTTSFSAYTIGERKSLHPEFSLDKDSYYLKEPVRIKGIVYDELKSIVSGITIKAQVKGTAISESAISDDKGIFTLEFLAPEKEGDYDLVISAYGYVYIPFNKTIELKVLRSKEISLIVPDAIRVPEGENTTIEFSVVNTGQTDFLHLNVSLTGIPPQYFSMQEEIPSLKAGEEVKIPINFLIPEDKKQKTYTPKFSVEGENISVEKTFALSVVLTNKTSASSINLPSFSFPSGWFVLPTFSWDILYTLSFATTSFSIAIFLKKRRGRGEERTEIKNLLLDIKKEINRVPEKIEDRKTAEDLLASFDKIKNPAEGENG